MDNFYRRLMVFRSLKLKEYCRSGALVPMLDTFMIIEAQIKLEHLNLQTAFCYLLMQYNTDAPSPMLSKYIRNYWTLESSGDSLPILHEGIFPDG
jgi:hypothetical protein